MSSTTAFDTDTSRWDAIVERDRSAEGHFYTAVKTTGIYCRPACPSRLPKRENVEFFDDRESATRAGYRPCKRCQPDSESPQRQQMEMIARACRAIEQSETTLSLEELASQANLSPWRFHRLFKEVVGVTPKQYAITHRSQRFRARLTLDASVTDAIYDAGFGSNSRAYEASAGHLGMTPSAYRNGGTGLEIRIATGRCFLGWVMVAATELGICVIEFGDDPQSLRNQFRSRFSNARIVDDDEDFKGWLDEVVAFIETPEKGFDLPLDIQGTAFERRVWDALRRIPPGATLSYGELAGRIGNPNSARAVAMACATNRVPVAIPCHRVIRKDGGLGGYKWGIERKRALLDREGTD